MDALDTLNSTNSKTQPEEHHKPPAQIKRSSNSPQSTSALFLNSYKWSKKNSCYIDNGIELWFRAFSRWSPDIQKNFLVTLPSDSYLATMFYHFKYRHQVLYSKSRVTETSYNSRMSLFQSQTFNKIWNVWKIHEEGNFGCAMTWMSHAITVSTYSSNTSKH